MIEASGHVVLGNHKPEANRSTASGVCAAHTRAMNTGSINVALCGMMHARERPFHAGPSPLTEGQLASMAREVANLCATYEIPITRRTVLTHAEVQRTLGVTQAGKWDITWLPGMSVPGDPIEVGDRLRAMIEAARAGPPPSMPGAPTLPREDPAALIAEAMALLTRARAALGG